MNNNAEKDTKKSIDRLSTITSSASSHTLEKIDSVAKKLSDYKENKLLEEQKDNIKEKDDSNLKTSENTQQTVNKENDNSSSSDSRLKTNVDQSMNTNNSDSNLNTATNQNTAQQNTNTKTEVKNSRLKTAVSKTSKKVFGFNDNQGKVSKITTAVSKTGSRVAKAGGKITRASRELNKAMSNDGTGMEYLNEKIGRKAKRKVSKTLKKTTSSINKKLKKKFGKKLGELARKVFLKLLKMLISLLGALAEIIIPIALIILIMYSLTSVFGSSGSDNMLTDYKAYMDSVQAEYDKKVDDFLIQNPDGIVVAVDGDYGKIDWRIPLSIMHGTEAELSYDQAEKDLLDKFKKADLFEKHEIMEQTVIEKDKLGKEIEKTIKVLVVTNGMYDDYMEWTKNNFTYISDFMTKKKVSLLPQTSFTNQQLELIESMYKSDDFAELLGKEFKTRTPTFGMTTKKADLSSKYYNASNVLTTSGFKGQCTWYSYGRALEVTNLKMPSGNAQTWLSSAIVMGLKTGTQPSFNSVVVLMGSKFGHVAFVESYEGGSITISEGNVGNPCSKDNSCSAVEYANQHADELVRTKTYESFDAYRKATINSGYRIVGFIYLD